MNTDERALATSRPELATLPRLSTVKRAIHRQRWKVLLVMGVVLGTVCLWTLTTQTRYTSEMILLVQNARGTESVTSGSGGNVSSVADVSDAQLNSEVSILNSDDIADEVVDPSWTADKPDSLTPAQMAAHNRAVRDLHARLEVSAIRSSHAIQVKVSDASPKAARNTLQRVLGAFLRKQRSLTRVPGASAVFAAQAKRYEQTLNDARAELAGFQSANGYVSLQEQESALQSRFLQVQAGHADALVQIHELEQRIAAEEGQLAATPQRLPTVDNTAPATGTLDQLNVLLVTLLNKRTALLTKYNAGDRLVREVDRQVDDTRAGIERATRASTHAFATDNNPLWQSLKGDLNASSAGLAGLQAKDRGLLWEAAELRSRISGTTFHASQYEQLTQKISELEDTYKAFLVKRDAALMNDLMDQQNWLNIGVVQYPTMSLTPSRPLRALNAALGIVAALLFGACTVFLSEAVRAEVSSVEELQQVSRYPVLASVPLGPREKSAAKVASLPSAGQRIRPGALEYETGMEAQ